MPSQITRIAVGIGPLGMHDPVFGIASGIAGELHAELHAVHVYDPPAPIDVAYAQQAGVPGNGSATWEKQIALLLDEHVRGVHGSITPVCHVMEGARSECLVERAKAVGADLLIIGATRQDRIRRSFLGTTAQGVISHAAMPTLLIRQPVIRPLKRVLFTTNLSDLSIAICAKGLEVLSALFPTDVPEKRSLLVIRPQSEMTEADHYYRFAQRELERLLQERVPEPASHGTRIRSGDPADCIVQEAAEWRPDVLVLGNHGYPGRRRGIGSVAGRVMREAARNVLVIPSPVYETAAPTISAGLG